MLERESLTTAIRSAFPGYVVTDAITAHDCEECFSLRSGLEGKTWEEITDDFMDEYYDSLTLLTRAAYHAFVPAWILRCVRDPDCFVTGSLLVNLTGEPRIEDFSAYQAQVIIDAVDFVTSNSIYGEDDPINIRYRKKVRNVWGTVAA